MSEKMILRELIKDHGRIITIRKKSKHYSNKYYENQELEPSSRDELCGMVTAWFDKLGWKTKFSKRTETYTSRKPKHHTKISWEINSGFNHVYGKARLHSKTPNGGWTTNIPQYRANGDLEMLVMAAKTIGAPSLITKENLPDVYVLGNLSDFSINNAGHHVYVQNNWRVVTVKGVVGLNKDGTIDSKQAFNPNENPWFHCVIGDNAGRVAHILTDGDVLHPLNPRRHKGVEKYRVTSNTPSFVKHTTARDKELLTIAIGTLFE